MENSSKALLIAAAVLIVILLVTFAIRVFQSGGGAIIKTETVGDMISKQIARSSDAISETSAFYSPFEKQGAGGETESGSYGNDNGAGAEDTNPGSTNEGGSTEAGNEAGENNNENTGSENGSNENEGTTEESNPSSETGDEEQVIFLKDLAIGTYVNYSPDKSKNMYVADASLTGGTANTGQIINQDKSLKWRFFGVKDQKVLLISDAPTQYTLTLYKTIDFRRYGNQCYA